MGKHVGKYESKEKTRKSRRFSAQRFLLCMAVYVVTSIIGVAIMTLLGWQDRAFEHRECETAFAIGFLAVAVIVWIINAVGNAIRKRRKSSE